MTYIYKVCSKKEWNDASEVGFYSGSEVDINDGFIHLSTINESKREKFGLEAKKQFLKKFLGEKVFRKFMDTINS